MHPSILVVDDEKVVRDFICINLALNGYKAMQAASGREAIDLAVKPEVHIDILVTDIIMPHMHGRELANRICSIKPFIKVLFMSAYSAEILTSQNLCPDGSDFIRKPFTMETLMNRISRVWAAGPQWRELAAK